MAAPIIFTPQPTSHVKQLKYNPDSRQLVVRFENGYRYTHADVPMSVFASMTRWSSPGAYYHAVIKRHYHLLKKEVNNEPDDSQAGS